MEKINRRRAVSLMSSWTAGTLVLSEWLLQSCVRTRNNTLFAPEFQSVLKLLVEYILPETNESPGAREAGVHEFVAIIAEECYEISDRDKLYNGLKDLLKNRFFEYSPQGQWEKVLELNSIAENDEKFYFNQLKSLTEWGYFNSKLGVTQGLRYNPIPGKYLGCVPYKGEVAWH